jgi:hypothetical protein
MGNSHYVGSYRPWQGVTATRHHAISYSVLKKGKKNVNFFFFTLSILLVVVVGKAVIAGSRFFNQSFSLLFLSHTTRQ